MLQLRARDDVDLVLLDERDVEPLYALVDANRAHLASWMPWAASETLESARAFVRASSARFAMGDGFDLGIWHEGALVGAIGLHHVHPVNRHTTLGYWLAADAQGKGIARAACRALVQHCFGPMGLHRVEVRVAPDNARSLAIPRALSFTEEGRLREVELLGGRFIDVLVFSCLAREWHS